MSALALNKHTPVDATAGTVGMTLPTGAAPGTALSVEKVDATGNTVTITGSVRGATTTLTLAYQYESLEFIADAAGSWRPIANHLPKAAVDAKIAVQAASDVATYAPLTGALATVSTAVAPTVGKTQPYSAAAGALAVTLPALSTLTAGVTILGVQKAATDASANPVTVSAAGSDTFDSGKTSIALKVSGELRELQVVTIGATKCWKVIGGNTPLSSLDSRFAGVSSAYLTPTAIQSARSVQNVVHVDRGTQYRVIAQSPTDSSLIGYDQTNKRLVRSADDGTTWTTLCSFVFPVQVNDLQFTADGEVLANLTTTSSAGGSIWKSTGWAANPSTATFTSVLAVGTAKPAVFFSSTYGGLSVTPNPSVPGQSYVVATEYGAHTGDGGGVAAAATVAHFSADSGVTWKSVFDLTACTIDGTVQPFAASSSQLMHLHGACFDTIWAGRIWLVFGDANAGSGAYSGIVYTDNPAAATPTWTSVPGTLTSAATGYQSVSPYSLPDGVVFLPDSAPNAIRYVARTGDHTIGALKTVYTFSNDAAIAFIGKKISGSGTATAPVLIPVVGVSNTTPGILIASFDSDTFFPIYIDANTVVGGAQYQGMSNAFLTNSGRLYAEFSDTTRYTNGSRMTADLQPNVTLNVLDALPSAAIIAKYRSGAYYGIPIGGARAAGAMTLNRMSGTLLPIQATCVVSGLGINVTTAAAGALVRLGLHRINSDGSYTTVIDGGTVDASTTGAKNITFTATTLTPGIYVLSATCQGVACSITRSAFTQVPVGSISTLNAVTNNWSCLAQNSVSGALPGSPAFDVQEATAPVIAIYVTG